MGREAGKDLPIELRMRLPRLARDYSSVANRLLVHKCSSCLLGLKANVFVAGDSLATRKACRGQHLDTMADGKDPFLLGVKFADNFEQAPIVAEVLRRPAAENQDGVIITHIYLVKREVGLQTVAWTFDVGIPPRLKVV